MSAADHQGCVSLRDYLALPRERVSPYVGTPDGRTVLLAPETTLLVAGPSGVGKSLMASWDLGARLAAPEPSEWLGLQVCGGLRVLLLSYEGSDEDTEERGRALVPEDARDRFAIWDRWRNGPAPRADAEGIRRLAAEVLRLGTDVVIFDPGSAYFAPAHDISKGIPEVAAEVLEQLRALTWRRLAFEIPVHTRKLDTRSNAVDEIEEIAGTFGRKADAAVVIRREDKDGLRRRVSFPKVRRGPQPLPLFAALPSDPSAPPRLQVIAGAVGRPEREGTEAERIAEWIKERDTPASVAEVCEAFSLSDKTLSRRRPELEQQGFRYGQVPGRGSARFYGTEEQWAAAGRGLNQDPPNPPEPKTPRGGSAIMGGPNPLGKAKSLPPTPRPPISPWGVRIPL